MGVTKAQRKKELQASLTSVNEKIVLKAINDLRDEGDADLLRQVVALVDLSKEDAVQHAITELLHDLRAEEMSGVMVDLIEQSKSHVIQQYLLSALWNSRLDPSEYLVQLVGIALNGDYLVQLECLTVIENFDFWPNHDVIEEALTELSEFLSFRNPDDFPLLQSIQQVLVDGMVDGD